MDTDKIKQHIVFLRNPHEAPNWGGLENLMMDWFARIDYNRYKVTLGISKDWAPLFQNKIDIHAIPVKICVMSKKIKDANFLIRFFRLLIFLIALRPSKVVFVQGWLFSFHLPHVLAGFLATLGSVYMHENLGPPEPPLEEHKYHFGFLKGWGIWRNFFMCSARWRAVLCRKIFAVSKEVREKLVTWWRYPAEKVVVVYNGVDVERFSPSVETRSRMRKEHQIPEQDIVFITASRLTKEKRVQRAIEAFAGIAAQFPQSRLLILGDGPRKEELERVAKDLPCSGRISFLGHIDDVSDYLKMSDVYILPSENEGFGIALVEAMSTGLICVATRCPGPNELIQHRENGFLVEKSTQGVLAGLQEVLGLSDTEKQRIRDNARYFVAKNFEINMRVKDILEELTPG